MQIYPDALSFECGVCSTSLPEDWKLGAEDAAGQGAADGTMKVKGRRR
jgi:hypothetical protein